MAKHVSPIVAMLLLSLAGCATMKVPGAEYLNASKEYFDLSKNIPWGAGDHQPGKPSRVVAAWADTVMYTSGKPPIRGFGGRLMFYSAKGEKPVKVEGDLVIYAFDEIGRDPRRVAPDKKYVIPFDQLAKHYSKGELGHSYSVWLPWDEAGGTQREISLIIRFIPKNGSVLVGEQTRHILPGATLDETQLAAPAGGGAQPDNMQPLTAPQAALPGASHFSGIEQASHAWGGETPIEDVRKMHTTTIDMSARFGRPTPTSASQRPTAGEFGTRQDLPSIAPGVETTVHYGVSPRAPAAQAAAAPAAAAPSAAPQGSGVANPSTLGRPGSMRPRNLGGPIERPVRERSAWGRSASAAAPAAGG
jgi:hypothetical protein